jgi:hypothetical protein
MKMKKLVFLIIIIFTMLSLNSQVSFNLDSTLNKIESEDEIVNLWLSDFDDNGEEEIWINYINLDDNYLIEFWRLVSYAPDGEILSTYTKNCTPEKQFTKCKIFEYNNRKYLIEIYNIKGQKVETLDVISNEMKKSTVTWYAEEQTSGIYFCKLVQKHKILSTQKVTLLK